MAHAHEYTCGCIIHSVAGTIRKCRGVQARSLSGRAHPVDEGNAQKHNRAMGDDGPAPVRTYDLAEILP